MFAAIRNVVVAVATLAFTIGIIGSAEAGHHHKYKYKKYKSHGHHKTYHGHKRHCFWSKKKVFVGHNRYGHKVYKFKRVKICR